MLLPTQSYATILKSSREILDLISLGILVIDLNGKIVWCNKFATEFLEGSSFDFYFPNNFWSIIFNDHDRIKLKEIFQKPIKADDRYLFKGLYN